MAIMVGLNRRGRDLTEAEAAMLKKGCEKDLRVCEGSKQLGYLLHSNPILALRDRLFKPLVFISVVANPKTSIFSVTALSTARKSGRASSPAAGHRVDRRTHRHRSADAKGDDTSRW